jgi:hypothetical protein
LKAEAMNDCVFEAAAVQKPPTLVVRFSPKTTEIDLARAKDA